MSVVAKLGTAVIAIGMVGGAALVAWNVFGQARVGSECEHSIGCRSFYCIHHERYGTEQVRAPHGTCTRACGSDAECDDIGGACVALGAEALDDLPPFGKPERACLRVHDGP